MLSKVPSPLNNAWYIADLVGLLTVPKVTLWSSAVGSFPLPILLHTLVWINQFIHWNKPAVDRYHSEKTSSWCFKPWSVSDFFSQLSLSWCLAFMIVLSPIFFLPKLLASKRFEIQSTLQECSPYDWEWDKLELLYYCDMFHFISQFLHFEIIVYL